MKQNGIDGKMIFVPLQKWETYPENFYEMRACQIACRMAFADESDRMFCMAENLLPPPKLSPQQLRAWCNGARAVIEKLADTNPARN